MIKNQLVPTTRTVCYSDDDAETAGDCHQSVAFNPRASLTIVCGSSKVSLFDTLTGNLLFSQRFDDKVITAFFSSCQTVVYVAAHHAIHKIHLTAAEYPQLQLAWYSLETPVVSVVPTRDSKLIVLGQNGAVATIDTVEASPIASLVKLTLKPTALAVSPKGVLAVSDGPGLQILSDNVNLHCKDGLSAGPALEVQWISDTPLTVLVRQKDTISFFKSDGGLHCYHQLKDSINRVTYLASAACPGPRPLMALSSKETGKCKLEIYDLTTAQPTPLVRWDVTRLGEISSIAWLPNAPGRAFVTVFASGSSVLWTHALQAKRDNWQTFVPNLTSCFTNIPHPEEETEFDFNMKGDKGVVNRYKSEGRVWDFGQGEVSQAVAGMDVDEELMPGEPVYPFLDINKLASRYPVAEEKVSDRHFTMTGEAIIFDRVVDYILVELSTQRRSWFVT